MEICLYNVHHELCSPLETLQRQQHLSEKQSNFGSIDSLRGPNGSTVNTKDYDGTLSRSRVNPHTAELEYINSSKISNKQGFGLSCRASVTLFVDRFLEY